MVRKPPADVKEYIEVRVLPAILDIGNGKTLVVDAMVRFPRLALKEAVDFHPKQVILEMQQQQQKNECIVRIVHRTNEVNNNNRGGNKTNRKKK